MSWRDVNRQLFLTLYLHRCGRREERRGGDAAGRPLVFAVRGPAAAGEAPLVGAGGGRRVAAAALGYGPNAVDEGLGVGLLRQDLRQLLRADHQLDLPHPRRRLLAQRERLRPRPPPPAEEHVAVERHSVRRRAVGCGRSGVGGGRGVVLRSVVEREEVVEVAADEGLVVEERAGGRVALEDAVAGKLVGDELGGDRRVELHDAPGGRHHPYGLPLPAGRPRHPPPNAISHTLILRELEQTSGRATAGKKHHRLLPVASSQHEREGGRGRSVQ
ncbi:unnamed protein product [Victoria cruziana]